MSEHQFVKTGRSPREVQCSTCGLRFITAHDSERMAIDCVKEAHAEFKKEQRTCVQCGQPFTSINVVTKHQTRVRNRCVKCTTKNAHKNDFYNFQLQNVVEKAE